jgi:hypothetical protein
MQVIKFLSTATIQIEGRKFHMSPKGIVHVSDSNKVIVENGTLEWIWDGFLWIENSLIPKSKEK